MDFPYLSESSLADDIIVREAVRTIFNQLSDFFRLLWRMILYFFPWFIIFILAFVLKFSLFFFLLICLFIKKLWPWAFLQDRQNSFMVFFNKFRRWSHIIVHSMRFQFLILNIKLIDFTLVKSEHLWSRWGLRMSWRFLIKLFLGFGNVQFWWLFELKFLRIINRLLIKFDCSVIVWNREFFFTLTHRGSTGLIKTGNWITLTTVIFLYFVFLFIKNLLTFG